MAKKTAGVGNLGAEEVAQTKAKVLTRAGTRAEADALFANKATDIAAANQKRIKELFVQAEGAETMAPTLVKSASVTAATDAYFEKIAEANLTEAQKRYPELQKAAGVPGGRGTFPSPVMKRPGVAGAAGAVKSGPTAPTASLSGRVS